MIELRDGITHYILFLFQLWKVEGKKIGAGSQQKETNQSPEKETPLSLV